MSNLKPAPFFLHERMVAAILSDQPWPRMAYLPLLGTLVDLPRRSEDPRLAKANDDCPRGPDCEPDHGPLPDPLHEPAPETFPSPDWPDSPLPFSPDEECDPCSR